MLVVARCSGVGEMREGGPKIAITRELDEQLVWIYLHIVGEETESNLGNKTIRLQDFKEGFYKEKKNPKIYWCIFCTLYISYWSWQKFNEVGAIKTF